MLRPSSSSPSLLLYRFPLLFWLLLYLLCSTSNSESLSNTTLLRFPLIRRSVNGLDSYFIQLLVGTQKVVLLLDSRNEGLRLFSQQLSSPLPSSSSTSIQYVIPVENGNSRVESRASVSVPRDQNTSSDTQLKSTAESPYDPYASPSIKFCLSGQRCSLGWEGIVGSYVCTPSSKNPMDAQFFKMWHSERHARHKRRVLLLNPRSYSALQPSPFLRPNFCEERAEGTDVVEFTSDSPFLIDHGNRGASRQTLRTSTLRLKDAPIKLVRRLFPCSSDDRDYDEPFSSEFSHRIFEAFFNPGLANHTSGDELHESPTSSPLFSVGSDLLTHDDERNIDGIIGIAGPTCRTNTFLNLTLTESKTSIVGIDLTTRDSPFISLSNSVDPSVLWSEGNQPLISESELKYDFFTSYDWRVCGVDIGYNVSSHWGTTIDLNTPCLVLPKPLWNAVMSWIPVNCSEASNQCHLTKDYGAKKERLPALSFSLSPNIFSSLETQAGLPSTNSSRIEIPLDSLIIPQSSPQTLCIEKLSDENGTDQNSQQLHQPISSSISSSIKIGTMILRDISVLIDHKTGRVGLRPPPKDNRLSNDATCVPKQSCKGQETFYPPQNSCISPSCNAWFFKSLNLKTGYCEYVPASLLVLCIIIPVFVVADLFSNIFYWKTQAVF